MKKALVCGAGGFIAGHLVKKLKQEGYWVRGVDLKPHDWSPSAADEFRLLDLRQEENCRASLTVDGGTFDEVYQLAADMGGMGFIHSAETEIMHNSVLINIYMTDLAARLGVPRYFFSSSVCVYRDMKPGEPEMTEAEAIPAHPDNEYGWEKLFELQQQWLDVDAGHLFTARLTELRLVWQFDLRSFVRVILQHRDLERNPELYTAPVEARDQRLFSQLLYSYRLNPQTVLYLGYSDTQIETDSIDQLRLDRTLFVKLGYAWLP